MTVIKINTLSISATRYDDEEKYRTNKCRINSFNRPVRIRKRLDVGCGPFRISALEKICSRYTLNSVPQELMGIRCVIRLFSSDHCTYLLT